jgi:hypothetical protein
VTDCKASGRLPTGVDAPSATNPWLIKLEPGTYSIGATRLVLPAYVDLEGSGSQTSRIVATDGGVNVAGASELRFLGISGTGATADGLVHMLPTARATIDSAAITATFMTSAASTTLVALNVDHSVSAIVRDSVVTTTGSNAQTSTIQSVGASPLITGSTIGASSVSGGSVRALRMSVGAPEIANSRITATGGGNGFGIVAGTSVDEIGSVTVSLRDSVVLASGQSLRANGTGQGTPQTINVAGSILSKKGGSVDGGTLNCVATFWADYSAPLSPACG